MTITAAQASQKWKERLSASTQQITDGVNAVQTAPGVLAAAQADLWLMRLQQSQAKWKRNVASVSLDQWKNDMIQKGIPRIATGASAAQPKVEAFMRDFLPYVEQGAQRIRSMPKGDINQSIARAAAMIQHNAGFRRAG